MSITAQELQVGDYGWFSDRQLWRDSDGQIMISGPFKHSADYGAYWPNASRIERTEDGLHVQLAWYCREENIGERQAYVFGLGIPVIIDRKWNAIFTQVLPSSKDYPRGEWKP